MDVYSISTSPDPNALNYPPSEWLEDWPVPVMVDSEGREAVEAFGLAYFPFAVFVLADGTIAARASGGIPYDGFLQAVEFLTSN